MKTRNFVFATLLAATIAPAQSASADQCNDRPSTLAIVECLEKQTAAWDAVVQFSYENALKSANAEVSKAMKQAQELWLRYRDANCKVARLGEGTIAAVEAAECRLRMTTARAAWLGDDATDDPPGGADPMPAQKIRDVYALLAADKLDNERNPIVNPQLAKSFFVGPFLELWAKDQKCWENDEGAAQMWVGGQDYKISDFRVTVPMATADYQRSWPTLRASGPCSIGPMSSAEATAAGWFKTCYSKAGRCRMPSREAARTSLRFMREFRSATKAAAFCSGAPVPFRRAWRSP